MNTGHTERGVHAFHQTVVALVRRDGRNLTARQLGVLLTSYLDVEAQTVRGLAADLNISKSAITRTLDRLSEFNLLTKKSRPTGQAQHIGPADNSRHRLSSRSQEDNRHRPHRRTGNTQ